VSAGLVVALVVVVDVAAPVEAGVIAGTAVVASVIAASLGGAEAVGSAAGARTAAVVVVSALARLGKTTPTTAINNATPAAAVRVAMVRDSCPPVPDWLSTFAPFVKRYANNWSDRTIWMDGWPSVSEL